jgi:hypothetical protein
LVKPDLALDVLPDCATDFTRDGAVAGIGEPRNGFGEIWWNARRDDDAPLRVYLVDIHRSFFG